MKGIWKGDSDPLELINGKAYDILSVEWNGQMANVIDETGDNFLYLLEDFGITDGSLDDSKNYEQANTEQSGALPPALSCLLWGI